MEITAKSSSTSNYGLLGATAGTLSAFIFMIVHDLTISSIWFAAPIALAGGACCGLCIAWSYAKLIGSYSKGAWLQYNFVYLMMIIVFGLVSIFILEPVATMAELSSLDGPPHDLIAQAMPLTLIYTFISSIFITVIYPRSWTNFAAVLLTTSLLVLLLGLNVSVLGFVEISWGDILLVFKFFGLIVLLNVLFALFFVVLQALGRK